MSTVNSHEPALRCQTESASLRADLISAAEQAQDSPLRKALHRARPSGQVAQIAPAANNLNKSLLLDPDLGAQRDGLSQGC